MFNGALVCLSKRAIGVYDDNTNEWMVLFRTYLQREVVCDTADSGIGPIPSNFRAGINTEFHTFTLSAHL